jgi:hypothetical protein
LLVEHERAEHHEAHVAHARVGDQLLHVGLDHGHHGAVDDRHDGEADDDRREGDGGVGQDRHAEAQEAVAAELQQDAGEDDRAGSWCLDVSVGEPSVKRPHRHLDGERQEERE